MGEGPGTSCRLDKRRCSIRLRRALLDSIDTSTVVGVRDRALIGVT
jgi:hypothetical protein